MKKYIDSFGNEIDVPSPGDLVSGAFQGITDVNTSLIDFFQNSQTREFWDELATNMYDELISVGAAIGQKIADAGSSIWENWKETSVKMWDPEEGEFKKDWSELEETWNHLWEDDNFFKIKEKSLVKQSVDDDYNQIMEELGDQTLINQITFWNAGGGGIIGPGKDIKKKPYWGITRENQKVDTQEIANAIWNPISKKYANNRKEQTHTLINTLPNPPPSEPSEPNETELIVSGSSKQFYFNYHEKEIISYFKEKFKSLVKFDASSIIEILFENNYESIKNMISSDDAKKLNESKDSFINKKINEINKLSDPQIIFRDNKSGPYHEWRSPAAEWIINSGEDFMKNSWDVSLVVSSPKKEEKPNTWIDIFKDFYQNPVIFGNSDVPEIFGDELAFMVRTAKIGIPQPKSQTYDQPFLYQNIKKTKAQVDFTRRAELVILSDENLYFLNFFNLISNNNDVTSSINVRPIMNVPFSTNPLFINNLLRKKAQINLLVFHRALIRHYHYDYRQTKGERDMLPPDEMPFWVFEDVNFIGNTTAIEFKRDSADTLDLTFPFLFKRVFKVDRQKRGGNTTGLDIMDKESKAILDLQNNQNWYWEAN
jgi:hypothetical protein